MRGFCMLAASYGSNRMRTRSSLEDQKVPKKCLRVSVEIDQHSLINMLCVRLVVRFIVRPTHFGFIGVLVQPNHKHLNICPSSVHLKWGEVVLKIVFIFLFVFGLRYNMSFTELYVHNLSSRLSTQWFYVHLLYTRHLPVLFLSFSPFFPC